MLAIEVEFLTGRYVATAHDDRDGFEWPPHPARLFSALVAEWGSVEERDDSEREVLRRLEAMPPPSIFASEAVERSIVTHYVPVNDANITGSALWRRSQQVDDALAVLGDGGASAKQRSSAEGKLSAARDVGDLVAATVRHGTNTLPAVRVRQARTFPSVTPMSPVVAFVWEGLDLSAAERLTLDRLMERVTRLGHSSSLVACRLTDSPPMVTHVPAETGELRLRGVSAGQFDALVGEFGLHRGSRPRSLPCTAVGYSAPGETETSGPAVPNTSGDWFVFEFKGVRLPSHQLVAASAALRGAILANATDLPEVLHGHDVNGRPTGQPHVSFLGFPDVGHGHASGQLLGAGVMLPCAADRVERRAVLAAIGRWLEGSGRLMLRGGRVVTAELSEGPALRSLQRATWASASQEWVSATPLALPWRARKAGERANEWDLAAEWVADSCEHVGLARPEWVQVSIPPLLQGALPANGYPAFRQGTTARRLVHARVRFTEPVAGPLVLGSGRYFGLGLMRPIRGALS